MDGSQTFYPRGDKQGNLVMLLWGLRHRENSSMKLMNGFGLLLAVILDLCATEQALIDSVTKEFRNNNEG